MVASRGLGSLRVVLICPCGTFWLHPPGDYHLLYIVRTWLNRRKQNPDVYNRLCFWFVCFFTVLTKVEGSNYALIDGFLE